MKKILLFVIVISSIACYSQEKTKSYVVTNVSVVTMKNEKILQNQDVFIKNGIITKITPASKSKFQNLIVIKGKGKFIMPALCDAHVHFAKNEKEMERMMQFYIINGVTKLRSMRGKWEHIQWRNKYNTKDSYYPKLYLSPPPISWRYNLTKEDIEEYVLKAKKENFDFIKILSVKDEDTFKLIADVCKKNNIALGGHFPKGVSDEIIFDSNYTSFEHLGGLANQKSDVLESRLKKIKAKSIFLCPTLNWYNLGSGRFSFDELRNGYGMTYVSKDKMNKWIEGTKKYQAKRGNALKKEIANEIKIMNEKLKLIKRLYDEGYNLLLSPDSSNKYTASGFAMLQEMKLYQQANLTNFQILKTATVNFNNFVNENFGIIAEGKDADFIMTNANPLKNLNTLKNIESVFINNHFIDKSQLQKMANDLKPSN